MAKSEGTRERSDKVIALLEAEKDGKPELEQVYDMKQFLVKRSQWIFGGDGWLMISVTAAWTMSSLRVKISTSSYSIPKFTPTRAARLPKLRDGSRCSVRRSW